MSNETPTNKQIEEAYIFLKKWKKAKGLSEDDIQDIIVKYYRFYNPQMNCEAQLYKYIQHLLYKKHFKINQKHSGTTINYQGIQSDNDSDATDWSEMFSVEEEDPLELKEAEMSLKQQIELLLDKLTVEQRYIVEQIYFQERTALSVSKELGVSHQAVSQRLKAILQKLRK